MGSKSDTECRCCFSGGLEIMDNRAASLSHWRFAMLRTLVCCRPERCRSHALSVSSPCRLSLVLFVFLLFVHTLAVRGEEIGVTDPLGWTGTFAGIRHGPSYVDPPGNWEFVEEDNHIGTPNVVSEVPVGGDSYNVWHYGEDGESYGFITASVGQLLTDSTGTMRATTGMILHSRIKRIRFRWEAISAMNCISRQLMVHQATSSLISIRTSRSNCIKVKLECPRAPTRNFRSTCSATR